MGSEVAWNDRVNRGILRLASSLRTNILVRYSINCLGVRKLEENPMSYDRLRRFRGQVRGMRRTEAGILFRVRRDGANEERGTTRAKAPHVPQRHSGRKRRVNRTCGAPTPKFIPALCVRATRLDGTVITRDEPTLARAAPARRWQARLAPAPVFASSQVRGC